MAKVQGVKTPNPVSTSVGTEVTVKTYKDRLKSNPKIVAGALGAANGYIVLNAFCNANRIEHATKTSVELIDIEIMRTRNWSDKDNKFGGESMFDEKTNVLKDEFLPLFFETYGDEVPTNAGIWFRRSVICPLIGKGKIKIYELNLDFSGGNTLKDVYLTNDGKLPYLDRDKVEKAPQNDTWSFSQIKPLDLEEHQKAKLEAAKSRIEYQLSLV